MTCKQLIDLVLGRVGLVDPIGIGSPPPKWWGSGAYILLGRYPLQLLPIFLDLSSTFIPLHIRTGLWRLVHAKVEKLDEREIQQNLESLRYSYVIFAISSLLIILILD